jgi:hypothetical protein
VDPVSDPTTSPWRCTSHMISKIKTQSASHCFLYWESYFPRPQNLLCITVIYNRSLLSLSILKSGFLGPSWTIKFHFPPPYIQVYHKGTTILFVPLWCSLYALFHWNTLLNVAEVVRSTHILVVAIRNKGNVYHMGTVILSLIWRFCAKSWAEPFQYVFEKAMDRSVAGFNMLYV